MTSRRTDWQTNLFAIVLVYVFVAYLVFALRHPWATQTETFLSPLKVLTFGTIDYAEMRPR